ncbi:MAG: thiamine pyrophosphate-dependent enzyme [Dehalococcoidia bacterium]|jgi:2-oxoglutarate ferredoxin oxidoreductase subunit beta|nr:thiamine pyrophosphate-dependent enzyme [Dehalococcoidia bacterium]
MTKRNPDYDFKWCPGCGDFGVVRAFEIALADRAERLNEPIENTVVVAGIGCSGNLVHLQDGPQPFGIHGIHGRSLPIAFGVKAGRPELNVVVVAGDGDFLSIGGEHIGPQARRNLDITAVVMDNGIYGLTKGQASPTSLVGQVTTTTPAGKLDEPVNPLELYLASGVPHITSAISSRPKDVAAFIGAAMDFRGFSIVHIKSPCTYFNDTYAALKGDPKRGVEPVAYPLPDDHDATDYMAALEHARHGRVPVGELYRKPDGVPMQDRLRAASERSMVKERGVDEMLAVLVV